MTSILAGVLAIAGAVPTELRFEPWFTHRSVTVSIARAPKGIPWVRGEAELPVSAQAVLDVVTHFESYRTFMSPVVKKATVLERGPAGARIHFVWPYPFPFRNRDAVVLYRTDPPEDGVSIVTWRDDARPGDPAEGVRIARVAGETRIEPLALDRCRVTYTYLGDLGGKFPDSAEDKAWRAEPVGYILAIRRSLGLPIPPKTPVKAEAAPDSGQQPRSRRDGLRAGLSGPLPAFPVVASTPKRHEQQPAERDPLRGVKRGNPDGDRRLRDIEADRPVQVVPRGEDARPVRVGLVAVVRVMDAVHPGRDNQAREHAFQRKRKARVRVMEEDRCGEKDLVHRDGERIGADDDDLQGPIPDRKHELAEVKTQSRRGVHVAVHVVNAMEAPEEGNAVVDPVPEPQRVVEQDDRCHRADEPAHRDPMQEADLRFHRPLRYRQQNRNLQQLEDRETQARKREVAAKASKLRLAGAAQGKSRLHQQEQQERAGNSRGSNPGAKVRRHASNPTTEA